jgi:hypothetical protein
MGHKRSRIEIDWEHVFVDKAAPDIETEVEFVESPSSAPHSGAAGKRTRAGGAARAASSDEDKRRRTPSPSPKRRFRELRSGVGRRVLGGRSRGAVAAEEDGGGARRPVTRAATKVRTHARPRPRPARVAAVCRIGLNRLIIIMNESIGIFGG